MRKLLVLMTMPMKRVHAWQSEFHLDIGKIVKDIHATQALAQLKRSTETPWHDQLYSYAAVIREKKCARRLALQQQELNVSVQTFHCVVRMLELPSILKLLCFQDRLLIASSVVAPCLAFPLNMISCRSLQVKIQTT